jgi:hypothetical protein
MGEGDFMLARDISEIGCLLRQRQKISSEHSA